MKPKLILLDAVIVIDLFRLGFWKQIVQECEIYLPSIISDVEASYYKDSFGHHVIIEMEYYIKNKQINIIEADAYEIISLERNFDNSFHLDNGEKEALALMLTDKASDHKFCTSDAAAIYALSMLNMRDRGISLEELLGNIGIKSEKLEKKHMKEFFKDCLDYGFGKRIRGEGLATTSRFRI